MSRPWPRRPAACHALPVAGMVLVLACHDAAAPTAPELRPAAAGPEVARRGNAAALTAAPAALGFLLPDATPATVTARVQYVGTITAATSSAQCATVSPSSVPATKPAGSSTYVATFSVTPVSAGSCTITLTDKQGKQVQVAVHVEAALTERMVYVSGGFGNTEVFALDPDGTVTQLTEGYSGAAPAVAPDGRIVFAVDRNPDHNREIYIMGADGSVPTRLTFDEPHGPSDADPTVSPDGQLIAFSKSIVRTDGSFFTDIYVMETDGANPVPLTGSDGLYFSPGYSPSGSRIVLTGYDAGNADIYIMDADGSDRIRLTTDLGSDTGPVFGPDGRIVFASDRSGSYDLYRMDADGSNLTRLTSDPGRELDPAFTGDGRLVFASDRDGDLEIYLHGATGAWHPLTDSTEPDHSPAF